MPVKHAAAALATDGRVYVALQEVGCSPRAKRLLHELGRELGVVLFVGVTRPGLTPAVLLARLDDAAAEAVARQRRRRTVRRS